MAAQYDALGNYLGDWETEEERRKRMAEIDAMMDDLDEDVLDLEEALKKTEDK